jgi:hypothetical protein
MYVRDGEINDNDNHNNLVHNIQERQAEDWTLNADQYI